MLNGLEKRNRREKKMKERITNNFWWTMKERKFKGQSKRQNNCLVRQIVIVASMLWKICVSFCLPFRHSTGFRKVRVFVVGNL